MISKRIAMVLFCSVLVGCASVPKKQEMVEASASKQEQIEALKKMQTNYKKQTGEASRNSGHMERLSQLQNDVKSMKKRKADMQKEEQ